MVDEDEKLAAYWRACVRRDAGGCITQLQEALPLTLKEAPMKPIPVSFIITAVLLLIAAYFGSHLALAEQLQS